MNPCWLKSKDISLHLMLDSVSLSLSGCIVKAILLKNCSFSQTIFKYSRFLEDLGDNGKSVFCSSTTIQTFRMMTKKNGTIPLMSKLE